MIDLNRLIEVISPSWALKRSRDRLLNEEFKRAYESSKITRTKNYPRDDRNPNPVINEALRDYRGIARSLDQNYDVVSGGLDALCAKIVGADGIYIEPRPKTLNGDIDVDAQKSIRRILKEWAKRPEVTRSMDWAGAQRLLVRTWLRDGEVLVRDFIGNVKGLRHNSIIPYSFQLIESNALPLGYPDERQNIYDGIEYDKWGKAIYYYFYENYLRNNRSSYHNLDGNKLIKVKASNVKHLKNFTRINQNRGMTKLASSISRFGDTKDYEDSERIFQRIRAAIGLSVTKDNFNWQGQDDNEYKFQPGMVFYNNINDKIEILESRQNGEYSPSYREAMLRAASRGLNVGPSILMGMFEGSYSSGRMEVIEQDELYNVMAGQFICDHILPTYELIISLSLSLGLINLSRGIDMDTIKDAIYSKPATLRVDPEKEAKANQVNVSAGFVPKSTVMRTYKQDPIEATVQITREQEYDKDHGLSFTTSSYIDDDSTDDENDDESNSNRNFRVVNE